MTARLFFSYSHKDEDLRNQLEIHLTALKLQGQIDTWHDRRIVPGDNIDNKISAELEDAKIILLLISPDFIASDYCYGVESIRALKRHEANEARVIPVVLRPCNWRELPFGKLLALPTDGKPITSWADRDEAFLNVVEGIKNALTKVEAEKEDQSLEQRQTLLHATNSAQSLSDEDGSEFLHEVSLWVYSQLRNSTDEPSGTDADSVSTAEELVYRAIEQNRNGEHEAAISTCDEVVERFGNGDTAELRGWVARSLVFKGSVQEGRRQFGASMAAYDEVIDRFGDSKTSGLSFWVSMSLLFKGNVHSQLGDSQAAIAAYNEFVSRTDNEDAAKFQNSMVAKGLFVRASEYSQLDQPKAAIDAYDKVIERFQNVDEIDIQEWVAMGLSFKGREFNKLNELESEIGSYDKVIERYGHSNAPEIQNAVGGALFFRAEAQSRLGKFKEAIADFDEFIKCFEDSNLEDWQQSVAKALLYKSMMQIRLGEFEGVIDTCNEVIDRYRQSRESEILALVGSALLNRSRAQIEVGGIAGLLNVGDELKLRFGNLVDEDDIPFQWWAGWLRVKVLILQGSPADALEELGPVYATFQTENEAMKWALVELIVELVKTGVSARPLADILSGNKKRCEALGPLGVLMRQYAGKSGRIPTESVENFQNVLENFNTRINPKDQG